MVTFDEGLVLTRLTIATCSILSHLTKASYNTVNYCHVFYPITFDEGLVLTRSTIATCSIQEIPHGQSSTCRVNSVELPLVCER